MVVKQALMSGICHVDTASNFRFKSAERTIGSALQTLERKYGLKRQGFFITSKQGYSCSDVDEKCPRDIDVKDVIARSGGRLQESDFLVGKDEKDLMHMMWEDAIEASLEEMEKISVGDFDKKNAKQKLVQNRPSPD